ncbi:MAG: hypothetical protein CL670_16640 [Balneola sp.]|nr:hypothetical protein [Balneola sp.]MBE80790.1 hypothetical protein [Balneola sp.]
MNHDFKDFDDDWDFNYPTLSLTFKTTLQFLLSAMDEKTTDQKLTPKWLGDYTVVAILGVIYILLFLIFTSTFNTP